MDIKEIAKRIRKTNNSYMLSMSPDIAAEFAEALIESYKAELLNEAGEPAFGCFYISDQVAAAILKVTKLLEEEITCLIVERDDLEAEKDEAEHAPWPEWAELLLKMIRERTGYDGFDDQIEGVDLPGELAEAFDYIDADEKKLRAQLAKAEQLWQVAQGRCDGLEEKLAKAEQRAAEACALQVATETKFHWLDAARVAKEIRSGEWRKFVKEV